MELDTNKLIANFKNHSADGGFVTKDMIVVLSALKFETGEKSVSHFNNDTHAACKYFTNTLLELKKLYFALIFKKKNLVLDKNDSFSNPVAVNKNLVRDLNVFMGITVPHGKPVYSELNPSVVYKISEYVEAQISKIYFL